MNVWWVFLLITTWEDFLDFTCSTLKKTDKNLWEANLSNFVMSGFARFISLFGGFWKNITGLGSWNDDHTSFFCDVARETETNIYIPYSKLCMLRPWFIFTTQQRRLGRRWLLRFLRSIALYDARGPVGLLWKKNGPESWWNRVSHVDFLKQNLIWFGISKKILGDWGWMGWLGNHLHHHLVGLTFEEGMGILSPKYNSETQQVMKI